MTFIPRIIENQIHQEWNSGKVIMLSGPRQVGKTTLLQKICEEKGNYLFINGDDPTNRALLSEAGELQIRSLIGRDKTVFIDEAQRIQNIGLLAKIIHDRMKDIRLILSGSSAFDLANQLNEALTGRKWAYILLPISWEELTLHYGGLQSRLQLDNRLVLGMYPDVILSDEKAEKTLLSLSGSYLYQDVLQLGNIRRPEVLDKLLFALAMQIGSEVNYNELSNTLQIDRHTVENYIHLLEKAFVIFRITPLSKNLRNELNTGRKIYFFDNGIRNAIIGDLRPLSLRSDQGMLWENFLMAERFKWNAYHGKHLRSYFWRSYQQQEVDYIEEINGHIYAYEFKWSEKKNAKVPKTFISGYAPIETKIISPSNFIEFVS